MLNCAWIVILRTTCKLKLLIRTDGPYNFKNTIQFKNKLKVLVCFDLKNKTLWTKRDILVLICISYVLSRCQKWIGCTVNKFWKVLPLLVLRTSWLLVNWLKCRNWVHWRVWWPFSPWHQVTLIPELEQVLLIQQLLYVGRVWGGGQRVINEHVVHKGVSARWYVDAPAVQLD